MNCNCPNCASWWQLYWEHPLDRRRTARIIRTGLATAALILTTAFLILYAG